MRAMSVLLRWPSKVTTEAPEGVVLCDDGDPRSNWLFDALSATCPQCIVRMIKGSQLGPGLSWNHSINSAKSRLRIDANDWTLDSDNNVGVLNQLTKAPLWPGVLTADSLDAE